jgi:uncharacterized membrane-anchored protein
MKETLLFPVAKELLEIIRRIAERGRNESVRWGDDPNTDTYQHLLDELDRLKKELNESTK